MTNSPYMDRVEKGAAYLDDRYPGWVERIDLDKLDMLNATCCVLAQASGKNYHTLPPAVRESAVNLGFTLHDTAEYDSSWVVLTNSWADLIRRRRAVASPAQATQVTPAETAAPTPGAAWTLPPVGIVMGSADSETLDSAWSGFHGFRVRVTTLAGIFDARYERIGGTDDRERGYPAVAVFTPWGPYDDEPVGEQVYLSLAFIKRIDIY